MRDCFSRKAGAQDTLCRGLLNIELCARTGAAALKQNSALDNRQLSCMTGQESYPLIPKRGNEEGNEEDMRSMRPAGGDA